MPNRINRGRPEVQETPKAEPVKTAQTEPAPPSGLRPKLPGARLKPKGDGITTEKPRIPSAQDVKIDVTSASGGPAMPAMRASDLLRGAPIARPPAQSTVSAQAKAAADLDAPADPLAVPAAFEPLTTSNLAQFKTAYADALEAGSAWAVHLQAEAAKNLDGVKEENGTAPLISKALQKAVTAGEPWAVAAQLEPKATAAAAAAPASAPPAEVPDIPSKLLPITSKSAPDFKAAFKQALQDQAPWALALDAQAQQKVGELEDGIREQLGDQEGKVGLDDTRPGAPDPVQLRLTAAITKAKAAGEPWALAFEASGEVKAEQFQQKRLDEVTKTGFLATPPEAGTGDSNDHGKVKGQVAADGSMKVPATPENRFVNGYIRTNPVVMSLREAGIANIYNPLYQTHLKAAIEANGGIGEAPPAGKGFLALTDHGFANCYNPDRSLEDNKRLAELSVKTGMTFEQVADARVGASHGDGKFDDALAAFDSFDPTKPGEMKIALDSSANGKVEFTLHSDGNGNVSTIHEHNQSTWTKIGQGVSQYGLPVAAVICAVVPGLQGVAAAIVAVASAAKGVYEGIKNGDWLGAVIGVVGAVGGGFLTVARAAESAADVAAASTSGVIGATLTNVANAARAIRATVEAVKEGSLTGILSGVGTAAVSIANILPGSASGVSDAFKQVAEYAKKVGDAAAFGEAGLKALKSGDYLTAFCEAVKLGSSAGNNFLGLDKGLADKILIGANTIEAANKAIKNKDYAGAVSSILSGVQGVTGSNDKLLAGGVALSGVISALSRSDPMGAAKLAGEFVLELTDAKQDAEAKAKDPKTSAEERTGLLGFIDGVTAQLDKLGGAEKLFNGVSGVLTAVKSKDPGAILEAATGLVGTLTQSGQVNAARDLIAAARKAIDAAKKGDFFSQMQAADDLGKAINGALDAFNHPEPEDGTAPPATDPTRPADPYGITAPQTGAPVNGRYAVRAGDTLPQLAQQLLGDQNRWPELFAFNAAVLTGAPDELCVGTQLEVPPAGFVLSPEERVAILKEEPGFPAGAVKDPPPPEIVKYTVGAGETLSDIAGSELGGASHWPELYAYNKDAIGKNPNALAEGLELKLPPPGWTISKAERTAILNAAAAATPAPEGPGDDFHDMIGLEAGSTGQSVELLDEALHKLGFIGSAIPTQTLFTENIESALQAFQKKSGLSPTGTVDSATADALRSAVSNVGATQTQLVQRLKTRIDQISANLGYYSSQGESLSGYPADLGRLKDALEQSRALVNSPNPDMTALQNREQILLGLEQKLDTTLSAHFDVQIKSLGDDVKVAGVLQTVCDTMVSKLAARVPGAGPIVSTAYDAIKAGIDSYFAGNGSFSSAVKGALGNLGGALTGVLTGKALEKAGLPKNLVLQKITGAIQGGLSAAVENSVRAVTDRQVAYAKQLESLKGQLDAKKIDQNQFNTAVAREKAKLDTDKGSILATVQQEYQRAMSASFDKALGPYLDAAQLRSIRDLSAGELQKMLPDMVDVLKKVWEQTQKSSSAQAGG